MIITTKQKPSAKRAKYRIFAMRGPVYEFEVMATSPEAASKRLHEQLRHDITFDEPHNGKPAFSSWHDPADKGYAWMIEGGDLPKEPTGRTCMVWNGKEILRQKICSK